MRLHLSLVAVALFTSFAPSAAAQEPVPKVAPAELAVPAQQAQQQAGTTASGLSYFVLERAGGRRPQAGETVLVHYTGTLTDGKKFDSSFDRNEPIAFPLGKGRVIKGWDEGIAMLGVGDSAVLVIPPQIGYGARGAGSVIPPNATLVFVVHLVDVKQTSLSQVLKATMDAKGLGAAIAEYRELKTKGFGDVYASEGELNGLGYQLLNEKKPKEAIEVLKLNVEAYPQSSNAYDSLGEAYMVDGQTALAIESYQKSLALDPKNANAVEMLKKLKGQ